MSTGNSLLAALAPDDAQRVAADLRRHHVRGGEVLVPGTCPLGGVIFPETAILSLSVTTDGGRAIEIGLVGPEGLVGWSAVVDDPAPSHAATVLLQGGTVLSITASRFRAACDACATLLPSVLRFIDSFMHQMSRTIVSAACDPAERRLARWLLMVHDRIEGDEVSIKHSELASLLNVRRATITDCLHILEGERALRCTRGRIQLRDRAMLEALASGGR